MVVIYGRKDEEEGGWGWGRGTFAMLAARHVYTMTYLGWGGGDRLCCVSSLCLEAVFSERARTNFSSLCVFV